MASDGEELTLAASSGDADRVASLLAAGADVDSIREDGSSSLLLAALGPYVEVVKVLLEHGANVGLAKANGSTPYLRRLPRRRGNRQASRRQGADPNAANVHGVTPVQMAAHKDHSRSLAALLAVGADAASADDAGNTALHKAARSDAASALEVLLKHGRERHAGGGPAGVLDLLGRQNQLGQTPAELRMRENSPEAAAALASASRVAAAELCARAATLEANAVARSKEVAALLGAREEDAARANEEAEGLRAEVRAAESKLEASSAAHAASEEQAQRTAEELSEAKQEMGCTAAALSVAREAHARATDELRSVSDEAAEMREELLALRNELGGGTLEACKAALKAQALRLATLEEESYVAQAEVEAVARLLTRGGKLRARAADLGG